MKTKVRMHFLLLLAVLSVADLAHAQGRLTDNPDGSGANGICDFVFTVHDGEVVGTNSFEGFGPPVSHE